MKKTMHRKDLHELGFYKTEDNGFMSVAFDMSEDYLNGKSQLEQILKSDGQNYCITGSYVDETDNSIVYTTNLPYDEGVYWR